MSSIEQSFLMLLASIVMSFVIYFYTKKEERISFLRFVCFIILLFLNTVLTLFIPPKYNIIYLFFVLIVLIKLFFKFPIIKTMITATFSYLIYILGDIFSSLIIKELFQEEYKNLQSDFIIGLYTHFILILINMILLLAVKEIERIQKKEYLISFFSYLKKHIFTFILLFYVVLTVWLISLSLELYSNVFLHEQDKMIFSVAGIIFIYFFITLFIFILYQAILKKQVQYEESKKRYDQLVVYTEVIEGLIKDLRIHKHDYRNTLLSIQGFLKEKDYEGLDHYFYGEILKDEFVQKADVFSALQNIKNPGIKGLLTTKINDAIKRNSQFHISIIDEIDFSPYHISTIDSCRILGILFDNAIEASEESEKKNISLFMSSGGQELSIIITNTFKDTPNISKIFKHGYSTKAKERGIGLSVLKDLIDTKYPHILLNTIIEEDVFIIELIILKTKNVSLN